MLSFKDFCEAQSQAAVSASAKLDGVSYPGSSKAQSGYANKVGKTLKTAERAQKKQVPEVVF
jgi:hypothetical protein